MQRTWCTWLVPEPRCAASLNGKNTGGVYRQGDLQPAGSPQPDLTRTVARQIGFAGGSALRSRLPALAPQKPAADSARPALPNWR